MLFLTHWHGGGQRASGLDWMKAQGWASSSQSAHMAHTSGGVGPWPDGGVHVGPRHPLQPHARQEGSLGGRAVSCEAAKLVGLFTRSESSWA